MLNTIELELKATVWELNHNNYKEHFVILISVPPQSAFTNGIREESCVLEDGGSDRINRGSHGCFRNWLHKLYRQHSISLGKLRLRRGFVLRRMVSPLNFAFSCVPTKYHVYNFICFNNLPFHTSKHITSFKCFYSL